MRKLIICAVYLLSQPLAAASGENGVELTGYVSSWTQDCKGTVCQLPKPGQRNVPVKLHLALPSAPGEASAAYVSVKLALPEEGGLPAELNFYAICPYGGKDGCAGRYFQAQVSLSGPAAAFCASAFNEGDFSPFPVIMCAGASAEGKRYGVTLHRQPL